MNRARDQWDNVKQIKICIMSIPEGAGRERGDKRIFEEIMVKNFRNLMKDLNLDALEAQQIKG